MGLEPTASNMASSHSSQLSYIHKLWYGWKELNLQQLVSETSASANCATAAYHVVANSFALLTAANKFATT
jgi:hypothetical protein